MYSCRYYDMLIGV